MISKHGKLLLLAFLLCGTSAGSAAAATVELRFAARVGETPLRCGVSYPGIGLSRASIFLQDFRVYVSTVRLLAKDGREVPVALTPDQLFNLNDSMMHERNRLGELAFHNTGLYDLDGKGAYPAPNTGLLEHTGRPEDMGRFRAPTLRNVEVTAPYMHDGSIATLDEVIDHYAAGGRTIAAGPPESAARILSRARSYPASRSRPTSAPTC